MILTKNDLHIWLQEDAKRNDQISLFRYYANLIMGVEQAYAYRYLKCLRNCEYHYNNGGICHRVLYIYYKIKLNHLGLRYHIAIPLNCLGYGVRLLHLSGGGGILLNMKKAGNYCSFNSGCLIGNSRGNENRPTIGDNVGFGPGAKAFGNINIGDNVFVAPNAVVVKDVPDNCIVGGVPAKVIKML